MDKLTDIKMLPSGTQLCLWRWLSGADVRHSYPKRTFYYHRRIIFEEMGIDISISCQRQEGKLKHVKYDGEYIMEDEVKKVPAFLQGLALQACDDSTRGELGQAPEYPLTPSQKCPTHASDLHSMRSVSFLITSRFRSKFY